jgi:hypothetical protein
MTLDSAANLTTNGNITSGSSSYIYAGGLRIGGFDPNTLYAGARDIGITVDNGKSISFFIWTGVGNNIMTLNNTDITFNRAISFRTDLYNKSTDGKDRIWVCYKCGNIL